MIAFGQGETDVFRGTRLSAQHVLPVKTWAAAGGDEDAGNVVKLHGLKRLGCDGARTGANCIEPGVQRMERKLEKAKGKDKPVSK